MATKTPSSTDTPPTVITGNDNSRITRTSTSTSPDRRPTPHKDWIRGVNLGGWLVIERYIVPYQFAITNCHIRGDLCWYPGQLSAPSKHSRPHYRLCDLYQCQPLLTVPITGGIPDYPLDEYSLSDAFLTANRGVVVPTTTTTTRGGGGGNVATTTTTSSSSSIYRNTEGMRIAEEWFNAHFDNFITETDVKRLAASGVTHLRVPLPHWIMGDVTEEEPWVVGTRWEAFLRLCHWARKHSLYVWPDIHTAPGSQNGFDNSGHALAGVTCTGWSNNPQNVQRSLQVIRDVCHGIVKEGYTDVVTGFGLLNEPFKDCNRTVYDAFLDAGRDIVRTILQPPVTNSSSSNDNDDDDDASPPPISIYVSDMFLADSFNNGNWWLDNNPGSSTSGKATTGSMASSSSSNTNTYLDSHYYHVFAEQPRDLSPRQHIAYTCQKQWRDAVSCCYEDAPSKHPKYMFWKKKNTIPSQHGVQRIVGEWSAAYDTLPVAKLLDMMQGIASTGIVPDYDRTFTNDEKTFLKHFVMAQMVSYESIETGTSAGWFYWTAKMEGGAFAEWDYLRGVQEGWIPHIATPNVSSEELYGTCYDILFDTPDDDSVDVIHTFPDPKTLPASNWQGVLIDDDVVVSHGQSLLKKDGVHHKQRSEVKEKHLTKSSSSSPFSTSVQWMGHHVVVSSVVIALVVTILAIVLRKHIGQHHHRHNTKRTKYTEINSMEV